MVVITARGLHTLQVHFISLVLYPGSYCVCVCVCGGGGGGGGGEEPGTHCLSARSI